MPTNPYAKPHEWQQANPEEGTQSPWLVEGLIPDEGLVVVASAPKAGKTCFVSALARAVAEGAPFLGRKVRQVPVAWCSFEESPRERLAHLQDLSPDVPFHLGFFGPDFAFDHPDYQYRVDRYGRPKYARPNPALFHAQDLGAKLLVVDCLHAATRFTNLAENGAARRYMDGLRDYARKLGFTMVVLHHVTKSATRGYHQERFADSSQILASASAHVFLEARPQPTGGRRITLRCQGRSPIPDPQIEVESRNPAHFAASSLAESPPRNTTRDLLLAALREKGEQHADQLASLLGCSPATVRGHIARLVREGVVEASRSGRQSTYSLSDGTCCSVCP